MLNAVGSTELASIMALGWRCRATRMNMEIHGTESTYTPPTPKMKMAMPTSTWGLAQKADLISNGRRLIRLSRTRQHGHKRGAHRDGDRQTVHTGAP